jgi:hypothetical protein
MISHLSQLGRRRVKRKKKHEKKTKFSPKMQKKAVIFSFLNEK